MSEAIAKAENQTNSLSLIMGTDQNKMASELQAISNFQTMVQHQLVKILGLSLAHKNRHY